MPTEATTTATTVAARIRELRKRHNWSQADLTRRVVQLGGRLDRSQITRVESGDRELALHEAILLAVALDTSLLGLAFPPDDNARVTLTPDDGTSLLDLERSAGEVRAWASGDAPLEPFQDEAAYRESHEAKASLSARASISARGERIKGSR